MTGFEHGVQRGRITRSQAKRKPASASDSDIEQPPSKKTTKTAKKESGDVKEEGGVATSADEPVRSTRIPGSVREPMQDMVSHALSPRQLQQLLDRVASLEEQVEAMPKAQSTHNEDQKAVAIAELQESIDDLAYKIDTKSRQVMSKLRSHAEKIEELDSCVKDTAAEAESDIYAIDGDLSWRIEELRARVEGIGGRVEDIGGYVEGVLGRLGDLEQRLEAFGDQLDLLELAVENVKQYDIPELSERVDFEQLQRLLQNPESAARSYPLLVSKLESKFTEHCDGEGGLRDLDQDAEDALTEAAASQSSERRGGDEEEAVGGSCGQEAPPEVTGKGRDSPAC